MTDYTKDDTIDHDRMVQWEMAAKLPYTITTGVTATREGLCISVLDRPWLTWPDVAERLRYREGENFCFLVNHYEGDESIVCETPPGPVGPSLHRLAAILCDDAEGFRVLHYCIHNLCKSDANTNHVGRVSDD